MNYVLMLMLDRPYITIISLIDFKTLLLVFLGFILHFVLVPGGLMGLAWISMEKRPAHKKVKQIENYQFRLKQRENLKIKMKTIVLP